MEKLSRTKKYEELRYDIESQGEKEFYYDKNGKKITKKKFIKQNTEQPKEDLIQNNKKPIKITSLLSMFLLLILMITSIVFWNKGYKANITTKVIGSEDLEIYRYYRNKNKFINVTNYEDSIVSTNKEINPTYVQIINNSDEEKTYNIVLKVNDINNCADNYEYMLFMHGSRDNSDLETKDWNFLSNISSNKSQIKAKLNDNTKANILINSDITIKPNGLSQFIVFIHKIDNRISSNIDIDVNIVVKQ